MSRNIERSACPSAQTTSFACLAAHLPSSLLARSYKSHFVTTSLAVAPPGLLAVLLAALLLALLLALLRVLPAADAHASSRVGVRDPTAAPGSPLSSPLVSGSTTSSSCTALRCAGAAGSPVEPGDGCDAKRGTGGKRASHLEAAAFGVGVRLRILIKARLNAIFALTVPRIRASSDKVPSRRATTPRCCRRLACGIRTAPRARCSSKYFDKRPTVTQHSVHGHATCAQLIDGPGRQPNLMQAPQHQSVMKVPSCSNVWLEPSSRHSHHQEPLSCHHLGHLKKTTCAEGPG